MRRRPPFLLLLFLVLMVLVPFLFWQRTWFGRPLSEKETSQYLSNLERPRKTQHALVQVAERISRGDPTVRRWYPQVRALATHEQPEIRSTVAWVMGQDNQSEEFHAALRELLQDTNAMVRHNAALSLVRFADASGREELRRMLLPHAVTTPQTGTLDIRLQEESSVNPGTLLARIEAGGGDTVELRAPLPGKVSRWLVKEGEAVSAGEVVLFLSPAEEQVWEALRALHLVGQPDDLEEIERFTRGAQGMSDRIQQQAILTSEAIRRRASEETGAQGGEGLG